MRWSIPSFRIGGGGTDPLRRHIRFREMGVLGLLFAAGSFAVVVSALILYTLVDGSWDFFGNENVTIWGFLTGDRWIPTTHGGSFGVYPLLVGTVLIAGGALLIATPLGVGAALFLSEFAGSRIRSIFKPVIEVLAGIPSVVYGFFALIYISPFFHEHLDADYYNAISAMIVMAIMVLPIIVSISDDALKAVPQHMREASNALGATRWETARKVVLPAASSGVVASVLLGLGRALGETMVVTLVAGSIPNTSWNPLAEHQTMTSYIAQTATGDIPPGIGVDAAFAVGLYLFILTYVVNMIAARVVLRIKHGSTVKSGPRKTSFLKDGWTKVRNLVTTTIGRMVPHRDTTKNVTLHRRYLWGKANTVIIASSFVVAVVFLVMLVYNIFSQGIANLNWDFLTGEPGWRPEGAGIGPVILGSVYLIGLTMILAVPTGVGAAVYLNEFAKDSRYTRFLRRILQNLAGVPSIVFGLVGAAIFVSIFNRPTLLAGALTLCIMVLPIIVVATEEALRAVPFAFREAALSVGATRWQAVRHHVLPNALPGIMTGSVLSLARALGETAPILFIAATYSRSAPTGLTDPFMALPVTIFYWTQHHDSDFHDLAATTIIVLLGLMLTMNAIAIIIRNRSEKKRDW
jgi:phosphate ABC transporter permease protein PstC/phosphate ABC transporter permease subunit PstA